MGREQNSTSRDFWVKRLTAKQKDLALVDAELEEVRNLDDENKLTTKAERLLNEIETINAKIQELDQKNTNSNLSSLSMEKSFQKIDFDKAKKIAHSINRKWGDNSGAILIF